MKRAIIIAAMLAAAGLAGAQMFAQLFGGETWTPAALNPVAWYKAENNALDSAGTCNGTWAGTSLYSTGKIGASFVYTLGEYVSTCVFTPTNGFSVSCWINPFSLGEGGFGRLLDNNNSANSESGGFGLYVYTGQVVRFKSYSSPNTDLDSTDTIPLDDWTHVLLTFGGGLATIYINGDQSASGSCSYEQSSKAILIGDRQSTLDRSFNGKIDDVLIFDRALTATEIKKLYDESVKRNGEAW